MLDARLAQPVTIRPIPASPTLTADQVENGWARDRAGLYQCAADKAAIVGGYQQLHGELAKGARP